MLLTKTFAMLFKCLQSIESFLFKRRKRLYGKNSFIQNTIPFFFIPSNVEPFRLNIKIQILSFIAIEYLETFDFCYGFASVPERNDSQIFGSEKKWQKKTENEFSVTLERFFTGRFASKRFEANDKFSDFRSMTCKRQNFQAKRFFLSLQ